ncbi:MAG: hypothetical protein ABJA64_01045 [Candidatus Saccharibacteria bacterium]
MLVLGSQLIKTAVMSLQTGSELARISLPIIDPRTLKIVAYEVEGTLLDEHPTLLRLADVREVSDIGMIIDSSDEFIALDDVIKIKEIYDLHFPLIGLNVIDEGKRKLGKVVDYSVEIGSFVIQQLTVRRPFMKSLGDAELLIHRTQIVEINDTTIIVHSGAKKIDEPVKEVIKNYANPFRSGSPQPETIDTKN